MRLRGIFESQSGFFKLLLIIFCISLLGLIGTISIALIASAMTDIELAEITNPENYDNRATMFWIKIIQTVSSIFTFLLPALFATYLISKNTKSYLGFLSQPKIKQVIMAAILLIAATPIINFLVDLNSRLALPEIFGHIEHWMQEKELAAKELTEAILIMETTGDLLFNVFMIGIVAALGEEILFRGLLQRLFTQWTNNYHVGIWIAAILFSAIHLQFYGFVPRMLLGALFGYLLIWTGTLWVPILAHFLHNSFVVVTAFIIQKQGLELDYESIGTESGDLITVILPGIFISGFILYFFYTSRVPYHIFSLKKNGPTNVDPFKLN